MFSAHVLCAQLLHKCKCKGVSEQNSLIWKIAYFLTLILNAKFICMFDFILLIYSFFIILSIYTFKWGFWPFLNYFTYVEPIDKTQGEVSSRE